jgi:hypothetical protein
VQKTRRKERDDKGDPNGAQPNQGMEPTRNGKRGSARTLDSGHDEALEIPYVGEQDRLLLRILRGTSDANIPFNGLCHLLRRLAFDERIRGSHPSSPRRASKKF